MYSKQTEAEVLYLYLVEEKSDRFIQKNTLHIDAPARGGGFEAMKILHKYGVNGSLKGALNNYDFLNFNVDKNDKLSEAIELIQNSLLFDLDDNLQELYSNEDFCEGRRKLYLSKIIERNPKARKECIKYHGMFCKICGFDFKKAYGEIGSDFIHVHHIIPLHETSGIRKTDFKTDLIPVCPNCHAMLHRVNNGTTVTPEELKFMVNAAKVLIDDK